MRNSVFSLIVLILVVFLSACETKNKYEGPSPVDLMIRDLSNEPTFSIILFDMQLDESKGLYQHKYRVKTNIEDSTSQPKTTDWVDVSESFFAENMENMGLELASKSSDGTVHKIPAPPGFNTAVGNPKYGEWRNDNSGNSFWAFYGQYAFMSTMFNMMYGPPLYRSTYTHYNNYRSNPSTGSQPYRGTGRNTYGTNSPVTKSSNPNFFQRKQQQTALSSFKQKVASNPSRYTRRSSTVGRSNSRTGYSSRSRGSSFGK
ncbi:MAG: hypothetical protein NW226_25085 [Microscillaceae bacterium]|nr:hypothetical protein [Microscillaceae bacterium]